MSNAPKNTIGQAIDQTQLALSSLDKREQQIVISTVCSILGIVPIEFSPAAAGTGGKPPSASPSTQPDQRVAAKAQSDAPGPSPSSQLQGIDIRTLRTQKQPSSVQQMACVVAFYLQELAPDEERKKEVTGADLERLFKQAGYKLPTRMQQVLVDAKAAGYFESVDRGSYRLTRVGYNLVAHSLPKASAA